MAPGTQHSALGTSGGQLPLPFSLGGEELIVTAPIELPARTPPELSRRMRAVQKRLARGAAPPLWKIRKAAPLLEELAGLFDGNQ